MNGDLNYIEVLGTRAKKARAELAAATTAQKNDALMEIAHILRRSSERIIAQNNIDLQQAKEKGISQAMLDRLALNEARIESIANACENLTKLNDPVGMVDGGGNRPNGIRVVKTRVPIGTIGIIYEARPNVTVDAAALCLKSGNAVILRGGSEAYHSNKCLVDLMRMAVERAGFDPDIIQLVENTAREVATMMMKANGYIDVLIPRGGAGLIDAVVKNATVPVIETGKGNCHIYIDESADLDMAVKVTDNAKTQRPSVCNAIETCLVHRAVAERFLLKLKKELDKHNVEIRGCKLTKMILGKSVVDVTDEDYATEYDDYILAVRVVDDFGQAIEHIQKYSTGHSECIITESLYAAEEFQRRIDAAAVYVNCSTRFTDGEEMGLGAEIGISTQKLHTRGPMGLKELTTIKWLITGNGQIRQ